MNGFNIEQSNIYSLYAAILSNVVLLCWKYQIKWPGRNPTYGSLPAIPEPGIDHIVIDGSEGIGESNAGIIKVLGFQIPSPKQNLFRGNASFDQTQLIMNDGVGIIDESVPRPIQEPELSSGGFGIGKQVILYGGQDIHPHGNV